MAVVDRGTSEDVFAALDAALMAATGKVVDRSGDEVESARLEAKTAIASLLDALRRLPDCLAVDVCSDYEQQLAAERLLVVARLAGSSGDVAIDRRRARNTMSAGRGKHSSGQTVNRDARRAAAVAAKQRLGEQLAKGSITPDAIDALSKAADDKSGEIPAGLVDAVSGMAPDQASRVVEDHLESAVDAEDVEREYQKARQARRAYHYDVPAPGGAPCDVGDRPRRP